MFLNLFVCLFVCPKHQRMKPIYKYYSKWSQNLCPPGPISRHPSAQCARPPSHPSPGDEASRQKFRVGPLNCSPKKLRAADGEYRGLLPLLPPPCLAGPNCIRGWGGQRRGSVGRRGCCKGDNKAQTSTLALHSSSFFSLSNISPNLYIN